MKKIFSFSSQLVFVPLRNMQCSQDFLNLLAVQCENGHGEEHEGKEEAKNIHNGIVPVPSSLKLILEKPAVNVNRRYTKATSGEITVSY